MSKINIKLKRLNCPFWVEQYSEQGPLWGNNVYLEMNTIESILNKPGWYLLSVGDCKFCWFETKNGMCFSRKNEKHRDIEQFEYEINLHPNKIYSTKERNYINYLIKSNIIKKSSSLYKEMIKNEIFFNHHENETLSKLALFRFKKSKPNIFKNLKK